VFARVEIFGIPFEWAPNGISFFVRIFSPSPGKAGTPRLHRDAQMFFIPGFYSFIVFAFEKDAAEADYSFNHDSLIFIFLKNGKERLYFGAPGFIS